MRLPVNYTVTQMQKTCRWNAGFGKRKFKKGVCYDDWIVSESCKAGEGERQRGMMGEDEIRKGKYITGHWRLMNRNV